MPEITPEAAAALEKEMIDIGIRIQAGEKVPLQQQLRFYRFREGQLSQGLAQNADLYQPLENIRETIKEINRKITASGPAGTGGVIGQESLRNTRNTPR